MRRFLFSLFWIFVFFCGLAGSARASFLFNAHCRAIYQDIFDFKIQSAKQKIAEEKLLNKDNSLLPYLENTADFLETFILEEAPLFEKYKNNCTLRLKTLETADALSPYFLFTQAEGSLQLAMVKLKFKEYVTAAYHIRKAYKLLEKNAAAFPDFVPNNKSLGLLHALMGTIPEDYKWLLGLGGMNGTMKQGLEELNNVITARFPENPNYSLEALMIRVFIELNLQKDKTTAMALVDKLCAENKENNHLLLSFVCSNVSMRTGKNDNAIQVLMDRPKKDCLPFYYMDYVTGIAKMNRLDADADVFLKRFIQHFKGKNYIKSACQKLAWHALIQGDAEKYKSYMKLLLNQGSKDIDEDAQAQKEAEENQLPNVFLLKARLLSDGGYYQRAVASVAAGAKTYTTIKDKLEVTYRMGRINQEEGNDSKAVEFYSSTLQLGRQYTYYFAANAALQLGLICEQNKELKKARYYYQVCLGMKSHDYQHSIDQKAKAGLNRLRN
jgi:hypothetical protein